MASLGLSLIVENVVQIIAGPDIQVLSYPTLISIVEMGPIRLRVLEIGVFIGFVIIAVAIDVFLNHTQARPGTRRDDGRSGDGGARGRAHLAHAHRGVRRGCGAGRAFRRRHAR